MAAGTTHQEYIEINFPLAELKLYPTQEDVYLDLLAGRLDAAVANGIATEFGFLKSDEGKDYAFFGRLHYDPAIHGEGTGIAIRKQEAEQGRGAHATIVALTASVLPEERARCVESGMDDYVAKPFNQEDLRAALERWL